MTNFLPPQSSLGRWLGIAVLAIGAALLQRPAAAQQPADSGPRQQTESPYFSVRNGAPGVDALPLKRTSVDVHVAGVIAEVRVVQH